jgi:uncharacterized protein YgfB (UPF0149 family)
MMNYAQLDGALKASLQRESVAFLHGFWHGLFANHGEWSLSRWLEALSVEFDISSMPANLLVAFQDIHRIGEAQIQADSLSLSLLLPDDDTSNRLRAQALQDWCEGYLYGLGLGDKIQNWKSLPKGLRETLEDIVQISQLDVTSVEESEEAEEEITALIEYVRLAIGDLADELHPNRQQTTQEAKV